MSGTSRSIETYVMASHAAQALERLGAHLHPAQAEDWKQAADSVARILDLLNLSMTSIEMARTQVRLHGLGLPCGDIDSARRVLGV